MNEKVFFNKAKQIISKYQPVFESRLVTTDPISGLMAYFYTDVCIFPWHVKKELIQLAKSLSLKIEICIPTHVGGIKINEIEPSQRFVVIDLQATVCDLPNDTCDNKDWLKANNAKEKLFADKAQKLIARYQPVCDNDFDEELWTQEIAICFHTDMSAFSSHIKEELEQLAISIGLKVEISIPVRFNSNKSQSTRQRAEFIAISICQYLESFSNN